MAGRSSREEREAQAKVLRAVLLAADKGLTGEDLEVRCQGLSAAEIAGAVEALLASGLLKRQEARLYPSGAATRFNRLRPL
jgi:phosphotransferase system HPr-like phosphotransfer protein